MRLSHALLFLLLTGCSDDSTGPGTTSSSTVATGSTTAATGATSSASTGTGGAGGDAMGGGGAASSETRLLLPPRFYGVVGVEIDIVHRNVILAEDPADYVVEVESDAGGDTASGTWSVVPATAGTFTVDVTVRRAETNEVVEQGSTDLVVSPDLSVAPTSIVFVGDSLTDSQAYPGHVVTDMPAIASIGTKTFMGVEHEGWSGSHWTRFATHYEQPEGAVPNSPFLSAPATIDIPAYIAGVGTPDVVCWFLGTNDVFTAQPAALESTIDAALANADTLLAAWEAAAPATRHAVFLMPVGNDRQSAFDANYQAPLNDRWAWRQKQHRWVERNLAHFGGRPDVALVPLYHAVDGTLGYPEGNALHPDAVGQRSIADAVEAWLAAER